MGKGYKGKRQTELAKQDQATKDKTRSSALLNWDAEDFFDDEPDQVMEAPPEEVLAEPAETEEEKERRERTVALAHEEAPGVDPDALELAKSQAMSLPNTSAAQKEAIINSMSKRLTIVQGPPGTGKTHTSVRILTTWVKTMGYRPLLATSECNVAVDNIAEGLLDNGIKVVRIGRLEKVSPKLQQAGLTNLIRQKREEAMLEEEFLDEDEDPGEEPEDRNGEEWKEWRRLRDKQLRRRAEERQKERFERDKILEQAEVICATTIASGGQQLNGFTFRGVLIDEVAQATETSCTVPIVCRNAQQLVLCGDHCQLPPSVLSRESQLRGLSLSLYSRLTGAGVPFQFLDTQYRAHPMLMEFSARNIYDGKLLHGVQGSERPRPNGIPWPGLDCPAMFMESNVEEHLEGESKANTAEALRIKDLVQGVLDRGEVSLVNIGVITPYKGQVRVLRKLLHDPRALLVPQDQGVSQLEIASVDNFQGREKEIIIFSAVRCNHAGIVGFLSDWRRLNVMVTRARRALVVVGNAMTLCKDPYWRKWLECTEQQGGARKGTVKKAMEDGELGANIEPCPLNVPELPGDGGPAEPAASWTEPQAQSTSESATSYWEPKEASSKKRKWSEKEQTTEKTWDRGWTWQKSDDSSWSSSSWNSSSWNSGSWEKPSWDWHGTRNREKSWGRSGNERWDHEKQDKGRNR